MEPDRDTDAPLQTRRLSYSFERDDRGFYSTGTIVLEVTNKSGAPAYLARGSRRLEFVVEGLENGTWVSVWAKNVGDAGDGALRLEANESATFEIEIDGFLPGTCVCSPIIAFGDGVYRLRIAAGYVDAFDEETGDTGNELPTEYRISNRFTLDAPN